MLRQKVLIYQDYGCSDLAYLENALRAYCEPKGLTVGFTDASSIIKENVLSDDIKLFVMPGGAATPFLQKLKIQGNDKIKDYIFNGGNYLGICAGAYYACKKVEFETDVKELSIVREKGLLDLVDTSAVGTLHKELKIQPYMKTEASASTIRLQWKDNNDICYAHYHGGPKFVDLGENVEVLACYIDVSDRPPAIVAKNYGKGRVVLSGVHFEDKGTDLLKTLYALRLDYVDAFKNAEKLSKNENSRQNLFNKIMNQFER